MKKIFSNCSFAWHFQRRDGLGPSAEYRRPHQNRRGLGGWNENLTTASPDHFYTSVPSVDCPYGNFSFTLTNPSGREFCAKGAGTAVLLRTGLYDFLFRAPNCAGGQISSRHPKGIRCTSIADLRQSTHYIPPNQGGNFTGGGGHPGGSGLTERALCTRRRSGSSITSGRSAGRFASGSDQRQYSRCDHLADQGQAAPGACLRGRPCSIMAPSSEIVTYK